MYADDAIHGVIHESSLFVVEAIKFTAQIIEAVVRKHGLSLNYRPGQTEAVLALRGPGAKALHKRSSVSRHCY